MQTNMIWGQEWDAMINYFYSRSINYSAWETTSTQGEVVNSGQSTNSSGTKDVIYNIYDLRTNAYEWSAEVYNNLVRLMRGGKYDIRVSADTTTFGQNPVYINSVNASRLTLYIK